MREVSDPHVVAVFRLAIAEAIQAPEVARTLDVVGRETSRAALRHIMSDSSRIDRGPGGQTSPSSSQGYSGATCWSVSCSASFSDRTLARSTNGPAMRQRRFFVFTPCHDRRHGSPLVA